MALPKRATSAGTTAAEDKMKGQRDESGPKAHSCSDEMDDIDGSDVRDAGPADEGDKIDEGERSANEGNSQSPTFFAHETAPLVAAVWIPRTEPSAASTSKPVPPPA